MSGVWGYDLPPWLDFSCNLSDHLLINKKRSFTLSGPDVFISYSRVDRPAAEKLATKLSALGHDVWWDHELLAGSRFRATIEQKLQSTRVVIVLWSEHSVKSDWVLGEAGTARMRNVLVPASLQKITPPLEYRQLHTVDLTDWVEDDDTEVLDALMGGVNKRLDPSFVPTKFTPSTPPFWQRKLLRQAALGAVFVGLLAAAWIGLSMPTGFSQTICQRFNVCLADAPRVQTVKRIVPNLYQVMLEHSTQSSGVFGDGEGVLVLTSRTQGVFQSNQEPQVGDYMPTSKAKKEDVQVFAKALSELPASRVVTLMQEAPKLSEITALQELVLRQLPVLSKPSSCEEVQAVAENTAVRKLWGQ
ncbi:MAG: toll/interleukin-1 receptor domain-containing protein, partial [Myxococcota bacterium]